MTRATTRRLGALAGLILFAPNALAQEASLAPIGFDAHGFHLAAFDGDLRDLLVLQRPGTVRQGEWFIGGVAEYADRPLSFTDGNGQEQVVLDDLFALNTSVGIAPADRFRLDMAAPIYFASTGLADQAQGAALGDFRLTALVNALQPKDTGGVGLGLSPWLDLPFGDSTEFLGNRALAGGVRAASTVEIDRVTISGDLGMQFNPTIALGNLTGADSLLAGVGVGVLVSDHAGLNLEAHIAPTLSANAQPGTGSPAEALLHYRRHADSGANFLIGGAAGLGEGVGGAAWRVFLGGGWGKIDDGPRDRDGDGILDPDDQCRDEPETFNEYQDKDGCPDRLGTVIIVVRHRGLPTDEGGLIVRVDGEPSSPTLQKAAKGLNAIPGSDWTARATKGSCLASSGGLAATDATEQLTLDLAPIRRGDVRYRVKDVHGAPVEGAVVSTTPEDPACAADGPLPLRSGTGVHSLGAGKHVVLIEAPEMGLYRAELVVEESAEALVEVTLRPARTRLSKEQIVILDKVYFETAKAKIKPESFALLDEVATVLLANPHVRQVEVAGHTDSQGGDAYNQGLSADRAAAVRAYMVAKGVAGERLTAEGYGEARPVSSNRTAAGRAENRRVEFLILEQDAQE